MNKTPLFLGFVLLGALLAACNKDGDPVTLHIRLTDGPGPYQQVNVDIREIQIKVGNDNEEWRSFNTNDGIYDLLDYQNGVDTLLATGTLDPVVLKEVRFILGNNNSVLVDNVLYPLETPSAQESGLKIKVDQNLNLDVNTLVLDFDAEQSVLLTGNGTYKLKPVIRVK